MIFQSSPGGWKEQRLERAKRNIFLIGFLFEIETQLVPNPKIVSIPLHRRLIIPFLPGPALLKTKPVL